MKSLSATKKRTVTSAGGWNHPVYTVTPGIPGDSGSGVLDSDGAAVGVLATLMIAPLTGSNGVTDFNLALEYLRAHTGLDARLVPGTEPFSPLLPVPATETAAPLMGLPRVL